jgi:hypothetical protein
LDEIKHGQKIYWYQYRGFWTDDLVIIGSFVPHFYKNDPDFIEGKSSEMAQSTVIHFTEDFLGNDFFLKPENQKVFDLFENAKRGIQFSHEFCQKIKPILWPL